MGLIAYLLLVIVVGLIVWLAIRFVPMPDNFKVALPIIALVVLVIVLIFYMFGGFHGDIMIPRLR